MSTKVELLASNHTAQIKWLEGQIAKNNHSIFLNPELAEKEWRELTNENTGIIDDQLVESFVSRYLSKTGGDKLYTTLRVAETRAKKSGFRLQCNIDYSSNQKLESMMRKMGVSKGELINHLIKQSEVTTKIKIEDKTEHQLQCNSSIREKQKEIQEELPLDEWHIYTKFSQIKAGTVMRSIDSGIEHVVYERDGKTVLFEDGGELDAYQAKQQYEFQN